MIRREAGEKNSNRTLSSNIIMLLCLFHKVRLCPVLISFTDWRIFIRLSNDDLKCFFYKLWKDIWHVSSRNLNYEVLNPCPAEPYHCKQCRSRSVGFWRSQLIWIWSLLLSMWIYINKAGQVIWLAINLKWAWHLNFFSRTRVNVPNVKITLALCRKS